VRLLGWLVAGLPDICLFKWLSARVQAAIKSQVLAELERSLEAAKKAGVADSDALVQQGSCCSRLAGDTPSRRVAHVRACSVKEKGYSGQGRTQAQPLSLFCG
jgi:hypothetical protein